MQVNQCMRIKAWCSDLTFAWICLCLGNGAGLYVLSTVLLGDLIPDSETMRLT